MVFKTRCLGFDNPHKKLSVLLSWWNGYHNRLRIDYRGFESFWEHQIRIIRTVLVRIFFVYAHIISFIIHYIFFHIYFSFFAFSPLDNFVKIFANSFDKSRRRPIIVLRFLYCSVSRWDVFGVLRGGNTNSNTNAGAFYFNVNNNLSNTNWNIGFRPSLIS